MTIQLSFLAMLFGLLLAIVCAWGTTPGPAPARWLINAYIQLTRNTPFLVQLSFFFFALPAVGVRRPAYTPAPAALVLNLRSAQPPLGPPPSTPCRPRPPPSPITQHLPPPHLP